MNVVFVYKDGTLVTPQSPSILEGITRDSILQLAMDRGHKVEGRAVSLDEWREGVGVRRHRRGVRVRHGRRRHADRRAQGQGLLRRAARSAPLALELREELTDIQYGRVEDKHGWLLRLDS